MTPRACLLALACAAPLLAAPAAAAAERPKAGEPAPLPSASLAPAQARSPGRCEVSSRRCIDFEGDFSAGSAQAACAKAGGTFGPGQCPREGRLGTCFVRRPGSAEKVLTRHYAPGDTKALRRECKKAPGSAWLAR